MNLKKYTVAGILFTIALGTLLHFTYDISGNSDFVAIFSAVNESTWEHLKLIFFPMVIFGIFEYFLYGKKYRNFFTAKFISILSGMIFITVIFAAYKEIIGEPSAIFNILLFVFGVIIAYIINYNILKKGYLTNPLLEKLSVIGITIIFIMFWVFTFYPPLLNIFKDPVTSGYGI